MTGASAMGLGAIVGQVRRDHPDLEFTLPSGELVLTGPWREVDRIRVEAREHEFLHLQSLALSTAAGPVAAADATVTVSSWYGAYAQRFDTARLLDWEHPSGTVLHTLADERPWCELSLAQPVDLTTVRLRNVARGTAVRARGLRVSVHRQGTWTVVYDHAEREAALVADLRKTLADRAWLVPVLSATLMGDYKAARTALDRAGLDDGGHREVRTALTREVLADRSLEWTVHGPQRCFRFWSDREKVDYVQHAVDAARDLAELTPHVCFGFGAVLSVVRDGDLIPHDDDLDIIIGFAPEEAATLPEALERVEQHMRAKGYVVRGNFMAHRHVTVGARKHVDVFVGLFEGDDIAWYPGKRGGLTRDIMFPTTTRQLLGVDCPLPAQPETYLERLYGPTWHTPDPHFRHSWDSAAYADQRGRATTPPPPSPASPDRTRQATGPRAITGVGRMARRLAGRVRRRLRRPSPR